MIPNCVQDLLEKYNKKFHEPSDLPPVRGVFDHRIPLEFGANPVNIRPSQTKRYHREIGSRNVEPGNYSRQLQSVRILCGVGRKEEWILEVLYRLQGFE